MRVDKSEIIAGLPAPVARGLARLFRGGPFVQGVADTLLRKSGIDDIDGVFARMLEAGYLERVDPGDQRYVWWEATMAGNALAMASFGKPVSRKTSDRLVTGLVERARTYNADVGKPLFIARLRIFGSYLRPEVDPLGDVDVELSFGRRITDPTAVREYTRASGRNFGSFMDQLFWPEKELLQHLRNRSTALNITVEDIDHFTDNSVVVYTIDDDPAAVPPPADRSLVGRA